MVLIFTDTISPKEVLGEEMFGVALESTGYDLLRDLLIFTL